jgi:YidC/Oxa1 family membrane protein insertase
MQKIQAPLQEIRAKYKDNPKKLQQETVKLFKENGVNPAAGCLPILIQIPIFLGLFGMLRTASELRFADFLWMTDLSQADTVAIIPVLGGLPLNIMPLIMGVTMVFQMRMMPTPTPPAGGNNEMAEMQQKMFKFMPFIMLIFLYNFSSGLVIYWTVQNLLTILQQAITNRQKDDAPIVVPETAKKGTKKVAAKKKK